MRKVAITGGIASGKSTVCAILKELGASVISCDEIVHALLSSKEVQKKVLDFLPMIEKEKIAKIVFNDPLLLAKLEKLLHPLVFQELKKKFHETKKALFVAEVPLLFETGFTSFFDVIVYVKAPEDLRQKRFKKEDFYKRQKRLLPEEEKEKKADIVLNNSGSLAGLKKQVEALYKQLTL